ncbi:MAG: hypothetical protein IPG50_03345 [Myxococcales bacterium]|nr:hypothetical protein [Myxococcales bacterium]
MKARAPGKLVLTGAYAVLEGAPAIVAAVDRYAVADGARSTDAPTHEVRAAMAGPWPECDVSALQHDGNKLGLGSSAAALVATLGAAHLARERGADLHDGAVRASIFSDARRAHAAAQNGGSGVDVAASTYGGVLRYALLGRVPSLVAVALPEALVLRVFFSGVSARTSELRRRVDAFREAAPSLYAARMSELSAAAGEGAAALSGGGATEAVAAVRRFGEALEVFGDAADVGIVPLAFRRLATAAAGQGAWFHPAGAGGGDVGVFCGTTEPDDAFLRLAQELGLSPIPLAIGAPGLTAHEATPHEGVPFRGQVS